MINKANLMIDIGIFAAVLLALEPSFTGLPIHEWFALSLTGMIIIHLLVHWQWMVRVTGKFFQNLFHNSRLNYIVDALFFVGGGLLGVFAFGCMLLTHPERLSSGETLMVDCGGDEYSVRGDYTFDRVPLFDYDISGIEFSIFYEDRARNLWGTPTGFLYKMT